MIEKIEDTELNYFKIKDDILKNLETVYKFSIYTDFIDSPNKTDKIIYSLAYSKNAIVLKDGEYDVISYVNPNDRDSEVLNFYNLHEEHQKKLLRRYIKIFIDRVNNKIGSQSYKLDNHRCIVRKSLVTSIEKINGEFCLVVDIKHSIESEINLWDYCDRNLSKLENYAKKGKKVAGKESENSATIRKIIPIDSKEYKRKLQEEIISYYERKGKKIQISDDKQPIVEVVFHNSKNSYTYLPEHLFPIISIQDLGKNVNSFHMENESRKDYLISIIDQELSEVVDSNPLKYKSFVFNTVKLKSKSPNGDIEIYENYKEYFNKNFESKNGSSISIFKIPDKLKQKTIPVFFVADESLKDNQSKEKPIKKFYYILKKISNSNPETPKFELAEYFYYPLSNYFGLVDKIERILLEKEYKGDKVLPLIVTVGKEKDMKSENDYYSNLKKNLLSKGFIHQHVIYDHIIKSYAKTTNTNFEVNNLIIQILAKYGIYPYVPDVEMDYDYIVGVDVGNDEYGDRKIGGAVSIFNKNGFFESILPIEINTGGEKVNINSILENIHINYNIKGKNILLIRDGILYHEEVQKALNTVSNLGLRLTLINVIKRHNVRILEDGTKGERKGVILKDNLAILLNHNFKGGKPIKITLKVVIENNQIKYEKITERDLWHLYVLSYVNYSNIYINSQRLRNPAAIHYVDKFVKSLGNGFRIREDLIKDGFFYFL